MQEKQRSRSVVRTWTPAEFRRVLMRRLFHWSGQQHYLLQRLQALGAQEMQWAQALDKGPCLHTDVHGARELHAPWTADHRGRDMLSAAGGYELSTTTRLKTAWKFKELLPVLSSRHFPFKTRVRVYSSCMWSAACPASETWPLTKPNLQRLQRNYRTMIKQIYSVKLKTLSPPDPMSHLRGLVLRIWTSFWRREGSAGIDLWNAPMVQSTAFDIQGDGKSGHGRKQLTERDCREWKLSAVDPYDRHTWRSVVRSAIRAASQLLEGAYLCGCYRCTCTLIRNPIKMNRFDLIR